MFKDHPIKSYVGYSLLAAVSYSIPAAVFVKTGLFNNSYILYMGNALFGCMIALFVILYNRKRNQNANTGMMIFAGHITTTMGVILACIISLLLLLAAPYVFTPYAVASTTFPGAPPQLEVDRTGNFIVSLFMNAVVGNVSAGSFVSIIFPYTIKRNQKGDRSVVKIPVNKQ